MGEITEPLSVGQYTASRQLDKRLITHLFECNLTGYRGWRWAVTMARPPRGRTATICEMELLPGEDALLAPAWVPWADRLRPGDATRSDRLPKRETDERLEPGWEATGEEGDTVALDELDLGRARVLSAEGYRRAAQRWYDGDHGPDADGVRKAHATCSTCGFLVPMAGRLRRTFGVCANEWAPDDGRVVSLDHGCGAHSETDLPDQGPEWPVMPSRLDESAMEPLATDGKDLRQGRRRDEVRAQTQSEDAAQDSTDAADVKETQETAGAAEHAVPDADGRSTTKRASAKRRTRKSAAKTQAPATGPSDQAADSTPSAGAAQPSEPSDAAGDLASQRAASARDAVAGLAVERGHHSSETHQDAASALAELEAMLPTRKATS
ncbi:DUF3027 domain-containing protein [Actinomyces sp. MRS3W]|uniref:DUF3027 domain-containing protein n=1 Tax=Actinomyces sp. MRS3W TaxID=2800796 RepID=UPI0028FD9DD6|nr:DUF3027 domain-containing protein [Actinomyces sp. MRS3W]MDU0348187.1 DUF3027 domain-containing protein [Actinomyces sp. MRS3W]